jgi:hypothetical protein
MTKTFAEFDSGAPLASGDVIPIWDVSASGTRKVVVSDVATYLNSTLVPYEGSGSLTVEMLFGGANTGMTYTSRAASYRKIGTLCFVTMDIRLSAKGSSTGNATISITGLPGTVSSVYFILSARWTGLTSALAMMLPVVAGTAAISLYGATAGAASPGALTDAAFANASIVQISGIIGMTAA